MLLKKVQITANLHVFQNKKKYHLYHRFLINKILTQKVHNRKKLL